MFRPFAGLVAPSSPAPWRPSLPAGFLSKDAIIESAWAGGTMASGFDPAADQVDVHRVGRDEARLEVAREILQRTDPAIVVLDLAGIHRLQVARGPDLLADPVFDIGDIEALWLGDGKALKTRLPRIAGTIALVFDCRAMYSLV